MGEGKKETGQRKQERNEKEVGKKKVKKVKKKSNEVIFSINCKESGGYIKKKEVLIKVKNGSMDSSSSGRGHDTCKRIGNDCLWTILMIIAE